MADETAIDWTDHTFNPWWGCTDLAAERVGMFLTDVHHLTGAAS